MVRFLLVIFIIAFGTSCSLAPFASHKSGKSYGAGSSQFEFGSANAGYYMKAGIGISESFDFGFVTEFGGFTTSGLYMRYSFINNPTGPALGMELGYGSSETTSYTYGGLVGSLAFTENFELFINPRIVNVSTDETDVELGKTVGNVKVLDYELNYLYVATGFNVWFSKSVGLSIYSIYVKGDQLETTEDQSAAGTFLLKI